MTMPAARYLLFSRPRRRRRPDRFRRPSLPPSLCSLLFAVALLLVSGCHRDGADQAEVTSTADGTVENPARPVEQKVDRGPLQVRLHLDRSRLDLTETATLRLEAEAPEDYAVELPKFDEGTGQFMKPDVRFETPRLTGQGTMLYAREYVLEPMIADEHAILPMTFRFTAKTAAADEPIKVHEVETEKIPIAVTMPSEDVWNSLDIDETSALVPAERLEPPRRGRGWWLWGGGAALVAAGAFLFWNRRRRRRAADAPPTPAHVIALEALRELIAEDLVGRGERKLFYNRVSGILRDYIENRFQLRAPEQTTEEFLNGLGTARDGLIKAHQDLLADFLRHCDLVKFAAHHPRDQEVQATFDACRKFITETAAFPAERPLT
jgi:hypothetical protein